MKYYASVLIAMCSTLFAFGQTQKLFDVEEITLTDTIEQKRIANLLQEKPVLYEDGKYVVRRTCSGEWGGSVYFKNKLTKIERACSATCAIAILKDKAKYVVVSSLAHMSGFSSVVEVDNPELLDVFKLPPPLKRIGKKQIRYVGDDESKSSKGTKVLIDTIGIEAIAAFVYQEQAYYIISGREGTFISKIESGKFIRITKIGNTNIWTYETMLKNTKGSVNVLFTGFNDKGYIDVTGNRITICHFK